ncbi:MAG: NUDIX domain-containing protein [Eubacteriales bacterium]
MSIRSTVKAIILHKNKILFNKCYDKYNGEYYTLPGGGQNTFETLQETLVRECIEETGYSVIPIRFAALCEEICDNIEFREKYPEYVHKVIHIFICHLSSEAFKQPTEQDSMQIACEWINVDQLKDIRILPKAVNDNIQALIGCDTPLFLGSEHIQYNHG